MSRQKIIITVCVVICALLVVWFVSPNREEKAQSQLDAAFKVETAGQFDQAVALYEALTRDYDGTSAASLAAEAIVRVKQYKERSLIQAVNKNLDRIVLVLNGYQEMMGTAPTSLAQLDNGSYMFDSDYIAEIVPEGYTYYLRFDKGASFTLYSYEDGAEVAVKKSAKDKSTILSKSEFEQDLVFDGYVKTEKGKMVFLEPAG